MVGPDIYGEIRSIGIIRILISTSLYPKLVGVKVIVNVSKLSGVITLKAGCAMENSFELIPLKTRLGVEVRVKSPVPMFFRENVAVADVSVVRTIGKLSNAPFK